MPFRFQKERTVKVPSFDYSVRAQTKLLEAFSRVAPSTGLGYRFDNLRQQFR